MLSRRKKTCLEWASGVNIRNPCSLDLGVCHEMGQGWEALCNLLDIPVPDMPFPHANNGENFANMVQKFIRKED